MNKLERSKETIDICWINGFDLEFATANIVSKTPKTQVMVPGLNRIMTLGLDAFPKEQASEIRKAIGEQFKS